MTGREGVADGRRADGEGGDRGGGQAGGRNRGADAIDLGAASSNPDGRPVAPDEEIRRLEPVVTALLARGAAVSIDSFAPEVQRWALTRDVAWLNHIRG